VESICAMHNLCEEYEDDGLGDTGQSSFSWGGLAEGVRGSEKDSKGLQRRVELLDELVAIEPGE